MSNFPLAVKSANMKVKKLFLSFRQNKDDAEYRVCNCGRNWHRLIDNYERLEALGAVDIEAHYILKKDR